MQLISWQADKGKHLEEFKSIFFASSSRQKFAGPKDKSDFLEKWTAFYLNYFPHECFLALEKNKLVAYLTGCSDIKTYIEKVGKKNLPTLFLFEDQLERFPAHLHINAHPEFVGKGYGSILIKHYINHLIQNSSVAGVSVITSPNAQNRKFYTKNGFSFEVIRIWKNEVPLLFMGRTLTENM